MKNKKTTILLGILIIILDQITKILLVKKNITIIPRILNFTYTENIGLAFGIGANNILMIIIVNIVILGIIIKFLKERTAQINCSIIVSLILVLAGGISNLIDRIARGVVVDFIDVNILNFPNFNIADISITIGIMILLIILIKKSLFTKEDI